MLVIIASLFAGCNQEEQAFMDALMKSQEILRLESKSNVEFDLKVDGLDDETQAMVGEFVNQVNDMKLTIDQKAVSNEEQTASTAQMDVKVQLSDMGFNSTIWVEADLSEDKPVLKEIFKLPSMLMDFIPGGAGKEYIVLDFETMDSYMADMEEDMPEMISLDESMALGIKYQEKFMDAFVGYMKDYDLDSSVLSKLDDKLVDGEKIEYYQVDFDNDSFKEFLKYTTISMVQDENLIPLFQDYMNEIMEASGEEMPEDFDLTDSIPEMVEEAKVFFEKLEEITLLGEDGIKIIYGVNEEGYLVSEEAKMDFLINTSEIMDLNSNLMEEDELSQEMPTPIIELVISYDTKMNNINEDIEVRLPETTELNSIDYIELMQSMSETMLPENMEDMELMLIVEDEFVEFTSEPIIVDGHYLVSSRDLAKAFGANIAWDGDSKEISMTKGEEKLIFNLDEDQLSINGEPQALSRSVLVKDGVSFLPLRNIAESFGYSVEWDGEFNMILINK